MNRKGWMPIKIGDKIIWLENWDDEFPGFAPDFKFSAQEIVDNANDVAWCIWAYKVSMNAEARFHQMVSLKEEILSGDPSMDVEVSPHIPFPAPANPVKQGAEDRIKNRVQLIKKNKAKYTEDIGMALRIIGAEDDFNPNTIKAAIRSILLVEDKVVINFLKLNTDGIVLYCKRGGGAYEIVGTYNAVPAVDKRVNLTVAPEERVYKARHIYKNEEIGLFSTEWTITTDIH